MGGGGRQCSREATACAGATSCVRAALPRRWHRAPWMRQAFPCRQRRTPRSRTRQRPPPRRGVQAANGSHRCPTSTRIVRRQRADRSPLPLRTRAAEGWQEWQACARRRVCTRARPCARAGARAIALEGSFRICVVLRPRTSAIAPLHGLALDRSHALASPRIYPSHRRSAVSWRFPPSAAGAQRARAGDRARRQRAWQCRKRRGRGGPLRVACGQRVACEYGAVSSRGGARARRRARAHAPGRTVVGEWQHHERGILDDASQRRRVQRVHPCLASSSVGR